MATRKVDTSKSSKQEDLLKTITLYQRVCYLCTRLYREKENKDYLHVIHPVNKCDDARRAGRQA